MEVTAIILAGGKSSRMGQDKGLVRYKGKTMVEYAIEVCRKITDVIFISTSNKQYEIFGLPLIPDNYNEVGPMGGIEAGLVLSENEDNIVCPCDMPNINPAMFEAVLQKRKGNQAVVLKQEKGRVIPVLGYYRKSALPAIQQQIKSGNYKLLSLLKSLNAETVDFSSEEMLSNFNTPEDLI